MTLDQAVARAIGQYDEATGYYGPLSWGDSGDVVGGFSQPRSYATTWEGCGHAISWILQQGWTLSFNGRRVTLVAGTTTHTAEGLVPQETICRVLLQAS